VSYTYADAAPHNKRTSQLKKITFVPIY
jgi:hypothetical protein